MGCGLSGKGVRLQGKELRLALQLDIGEDRTAPNRTSDLQAPVFHTDLGTVGGQAPVKLCPDPAHEVLPHRRCPGEDDLRRMMLDRLGEGSGVSRRRISLRLGEERSMDAELLQPLRMIFQVLSDH